MKTFPAGLALFALALTGCSQKTGVPAKEKPAVETVASRDESPDRWQMEETPEKRVEKAPPSGPEQEEEEVTEFTGGGEEVTAPAESGGPRKPQAESAPAGRLPKGLTDDETAAAEAALSFMDAMKNGDAEVLMSLFPSRENATKEKVQKSLTALRHPLTRALLERTDSTVDAVTVKGDAATVKMTMLTPDNKVLEKKVQEAMIMMAQENPAAPPNPRQQAEKVIQILRDPDTPLVKNPSQAQLIREGGQWKMDKPPGYNDSRRN